MPRLSRFKSPPHSHKTRGSSLQVCSRTIQILPTLLDRLEPSGQKRKPCHLLSKIVVIPPIRNEEFNVIIERDADGYFVASVPSLPGCHTQAKSLDELMVRIKEAIILCLEVQSQPTENLEFIGLQRVAIEI
jgi:predicted RNase H-like HicB family nuclease